MVQLDSEVSPGSMLVRNSTTRYELTGTGGIANTVITKEGAGTLVLGSASILGTGTTVAVSQGVLAFSYDTALPATGITWGAGSFLGAANGATVTVDLGAVTSPVSLSHRTPILSLPWQLRQTSFSAMPSPEPGPSGKPVRGS
ncbi:MAG: hypothetical protein ACLU7D_09210 [Collinsella sp.]